MKKIFHLGLLWGIPLLFIAVIALFRVIPVWAEWYSREYYPVISGILSRFSSLIPFSVGDCFIVAACLWLFAYPFYAWRKKKRIWDIISKMGRFVMWIYIWFYLAWGINYFRWSFYERAGVEESIFSEIDFRNFIEEYIHHLNDSYHQAGDSIVDWYIKPQADSDFLATLPVAVEVKNNYESLAERFGLAYPVDWLHPKWMLWSGGMSRVGVSGYMGPFFSEFNLNRELLNVEYPFTYAHELAHRLGIAGEAEANLYAYLATTRSSSPEIRFSGYFSLLGYAMRNARELLPEQDYRELLGQIRPGIVNLYSKHLNYWRGKYQPSVGKIQNKVYNAYLRSNKIGSGTKNYSEVIALLMSLQDEK